MEIVGRAFCHNIDGALLYFSFNNWLDSEDFLLHVITFWAGFYIQIVSYVAMQFVYRYLCLFHASIAKKFDGVRSIILILLTWIPGLIHMVLLTVLCRPDEFADEIFRDAILEKYELEVTHLARISIIPYSSSGQTRWNQLSLLLYGVFVTFSHYSVILYCGFMMHFNMKNELKKFSVSNQKLQMQFFKALIAQSIGPTLFLVFPIAPILLTPLIQPWIGIPLDWPTGWLFSMIGVFSPFDSIAFMYIVKEYTIVLKKKLCCFKSSILSVSTTTYSSEGVFKRRSET
ncbi:unnamed protein product [Caenorhabditis brenneri]